MVPAPLGEPDTVLVAVFRLRVVPVLASRVVTDRSWCGRNRDLQRDKPGHCPGWLVVLRRDFFKNHLSIGG
jgi:hypothetical protein